MKKSDRPISRNAFTLIELLVVVSIIVLLLSLLVPALDKALSAAELAKCSANLHAIGTAMTTYTNEHKDSFPTVSNWHGLLGKNGIYGTELGVKARPLNAYLGANSEGDRVEVAQCPSDLGESLVATPKGSAYEEFGTSYISYIANYSRIRMILGAGATQPAKTTEIRNSSTKITVPEWPTLGNRSWNNEKNRWHNQGDSGAESSRFHNVVFHDGHAELFEFDRVEFEVRAGVAPDSGFLWW